MGFLSAGVLNLNNSRDIVNDKASNKITLAVKLGFGGAKIYQLLLLIFTLICSEVYILLNEAQPINHLYLISLIPLSIVVIKMFKTSIPKDLDPLLKIQALSTLLFAITFGLAQVL